MAVFRPYKPLLALFCLMAGLAADAQSATQIPQGIRFYLSARGQKYFETRLEELLIHHKMDLSKKTFEKIEFTLKDPFNSDNLPKAIRERQGDLVKKITSNFSLYFRGLPIGNPQFAFTVKDLSYQLKFQSLSLELDPRGPKAYGLNRGVIALIRGQAAQFSASVPTLRAVDPKNPKFLGTLGADGVRATLADGITRPIKMEIPIQIDTNAEGLAIRVLAVRTNFTKVRIAGGNRPFDALLLPTIELVINGTRYPFDKAAFESDVKRLFPEIIQLVQGGVKNFFEVTAGKKTFEPQLNKVAKLANAQIPMLLAEAQGRPEKVDLKLRPTRVFLDSKTFGLDFHTSVTDMSAAGGAVVTPAVGAAGQPTLKSVPGQGYDIALAVHPGIVNAIVERMYHHKFLRKVKVGETQDGTLTKAPVFSFHQADPRKGLLHVELEIDAENVAVRTPVPIELDMVVNLRVNSAGKIDVVPEQILMDSVQVDKNRLKTWLFGAFKDKVVKRVKENIAKANEKYRSSPEALESIATPKTLLGIPLQLVDATADQGNLVIFTRYDLD